MHRAALLALFILTPVPDGTRLRLGALERHRYEARGDSTIDRGGSTQVLSHTTWNGRQVLLSVQRFPAKDGMAVDSSIADARTLAPIRHVGTFPSHRMELLFAANKVTGEYDTKEVPHKPIDHTAPEGYYDSSLFDLVIAALPLKAGYTEHLGFYIYEQGGVVWWDARVTGNETVTLNDGTKVPAWVVDVFEGERHRMKLWITRDGEREVVRSTYDIGPGHTFTNTR
jgi:hypothetical protein